MVGGWPQSPSQLHAATDHYGNTKAGFSASGTVDRTNFAINFQVALDSGAVLSGNRIKLEIDVQLLQAKD